MKKKGFIGLGTLLLVLLLGLHTTSYAQSFSTLELKNIMYNCLTNFGEHDAQTVRDAIDNYNGWETLSAYTEDYTYVSIVRNIETNTLITSGNYDLQIVLNNNGTKKSTVTQFYCNAYYTIRYNNGVITDSLGGGNLNTYIYQNGYNVNSWRYNDLPFYNSTSSSATTITLESGWHPSNIDEGPYQPAPSHELIRFTPIPKVHDVYVGQNLDIYTYGVNQNNTYKSMKFGDLYVPSGYYITRVDSTYLYFERASETWKEKILLQEVGSDITLSNYSRTITNFKWENYDSSTYTIDYSAWINREYLHANCMYTFTFSGYYLDESDPFYIEYIFYIIDSNTVLTGTLGDELDPSFLITGPYADEYAGDIDDLNDKVDENADLVDAIGQGLDGSLRPASGDWFPLNNLSSGDSLLGTAQLWGFRNYANGYWDSLYAVFSNTTYTLQQTGNVQLSVSFHGYTKVLNSSDFTTPSGDLKTFISSALVMCTMFAVYKLFSRKIEKIKRADLTDIKNEAKDDSDLM